MCCRTSYSLIIALISFLVFPFCSFSQPGLNYRPVISSLTNPVDIVSPNDGSNRLFIVQKEGKIKVYDPSFAFKGDFLTVAPITTQSERGLLSMAFHPDYKSNGLFFVYYTNAQGSILLLSPIQVQPIIMVASSILARMVSYTLLPETVVAAVINSIMDKTQACYLGK
jgi:Glucose / Sorbosone dehydrogenase